MEMYQSLSNRYWKYFMQQKIIDMNRKDTLLKENIYNAASLGFHKGRSTLL